VSLRLLLVRHAPTEQTRDAPFGDEGPPSAAGLEQAATVAGTLPRADRASRSPAACPAATAEALGLAAEPDPALADWDFGVWRGRTLDDVIGHEPEAVRTWMSDPSAAPHGGERLTEVLKRGTDWLAELARADDAGGDGLVTHVAVTHTAIVRACVLAALAAPPRAFWGIDVAPLGVTELHHRDRRWRLAYLNREPGRGR
jgi:broad specificity phosphatase PhoE